MPDFEDPMTPHSAANRQLEPAPMRWEVVDGLPRAAVTGAPINVHVIDFARVAGPALPQSIFAAKSDAEPALAPLEQDNVVEISVQAYAEGYSRGLAEGMAEGRSQVLEAAEKLASVADAVAGHRSALAGGLEDEVVDLALMIAERILHAELAESSARVAAQLAKAGIARLGECGRLTVRLHPADAKELLATEPASERVTWLPDPRLSRGDAVVEADIGRVDARLSAQLDEIRVALAAPEIEENR